MGAPTLRDVADLAGVSLGTASQALNNRPNVSAETRSRVLEAALRLGYQTRTPPPGLEEHAIQVVGLLAKHDASYNEPALVNPFYSHIQAGVEAACRKRGINLMLAAIEVDARNRPLLWPAMIKEQRINGLLVAGAFFEDTVDLIQQKIDVPIVLIDSYASDLALDSVLTNNLQGAQSAVGYLIEQGHRHIGLIGWGEQTPPSIHERRDGYLRTLQAQRIPDVYIEESLLTREDAFVAVRRLLQRAPQVSAIFACNDEAAIGVMNAARELGRCVPDDLSVVGFDNIDLAKEVQPALTTVHVHKGWMGMIAVRQLLERSREPELPKTTTLVATRLVVRDSACPPR